MSVFDPTYPAPTVGAVHDPIHEAQANARYAARQSIRDAKLTAHLEANPHLPIVQMARVWLAEDRRRGLIGINLAAERHRDERR